MTWIVAHANPLAVILMGDVRISVETEAGLYEIPEFGVKKVYHVAPTVFVGFAGNVVVGLRLIDDLDRFLGDAYDPHTPTFELAERWLATLPERAGSIVPDCLAEQRTDLLIVGMHLASVNDAAGLPSGDRSPMGTGSKMAFHVPGSGDADTERLSWNSAGASIGSGTGVYEYGRMLRELDWIAFSQWPDPSLVLTAIMNMTITESPTPGVSADLVALLMTRVADEIIGSGRVVGEMASDRSRIAESEAGLNALWRRFKPSGTALQAKATARG